MKTPIQELQKWLNEFKEVASYHDGERFQGMQQVLNGLEDQLSRLKHSEKQIIMNAYIDGASVSMLSEDYFNQVFN